MTVWDWLATAQGVEAMHVVIVLVAAVAALLSAWAARIARHNKKLLNGHLQDHLDELLGEDLDHARRHAEDE